MFVAVDVLLEQVLVKDSRHGYTVQDMTGHREADGVLHRSGDGFYGAFEHAPVGMVLMDLRGGFSHVNLAFAQITGYSRDELFSSFCRGEFEGVALGKVPAYFVGWM